MSLFQVYVTPPYGMVEQDDFLNGCLELKTLLSPEELLESIHEIEKNAGRERVIRLGTADAGSGYSAL